MSNQNGPSANPKKDPADEQSVEGRVHQAVDWAREKFDAVEEQAKEVQERATDLIGEAKDQLMPVDRWVRKTAKQHPFLLVGTSIGVGFLAGSVISAIARRSK